MVNAGVWKPAQSSLNIEKRGSRRDIITRDDLQGSPRIHFCRRRRRCCHTAWQNCLKNARPPCTPHNRVRHKRGRQHARFFRAFLGRRWLAVAAARRAPGARARPAVADWHAPYCQLWKSRNCVPRCLPWQSLRPPWIHRRGATSTRSCGARRCHRIAAAAIATGGKRDALLQGWPRRW